MSHLESSSMILKNKMSKSVEKHPKETILLMIVGFYANMTLSIGIMKFDLNVRHDLVC